MSSGSSSARGKRKVGENQSTDGDDIFSYLQSTEMTYDANGDELEIHFKEEQQVNILIQMFEPQEDDRGEEDAANAS